MAQMLCKVTGEISDCTFQTVKGIATWQVPLPTITKLKSAAEAIQLIVVWKKRIIKYNKAIKHKNLHRLFIEKQTELRSVYC